MRGGQVKVLLGGSTISQSLLIFESGVDNQGFGVSVSECGDLNNDGFADILAKTSSPDQYLYPDKIQILYGGSQLTLAETSFPTGYYNSDLMAGLDYNGDGNLDVVANMDGVGNIYLGGQQISSKPAVNYMSGYAAGPIPLGDINKDGYEDFFEKSGFVYLGTGSTTEFSTIISPMFGAIGVGDFDNDGIKEIISSGGMDVSITSFPSIRNLPFVSLDPPLKNDMTVYSESLNLAGKVTNSSSLLIFGQPIALASDGSFQAVISLKTGLNVIELIVKASDGRVNKRVVRVTYNVPPLHIEITAPQHGDESPAILTVTGTVSDPAAKITLNGFPLLPSGAFFQTTLDTSYASEFFAVTANAFDSYGQSSSSSITIKRYFPASFRGRTIDAVSGLAIPGVLVSMISPNFKYEITTAADGYYSTYIQPGEYALSYSKIGYAAQTYTQLIEPTNGGYYEKIINMIQAPLLALEVISPVDSLIFNTPSVTISGTVTNNAQVTINGVLATVSNGTFSALIQLSEGINNLVVIANDSYGQVVTKTLTLTLNTQTSLRGVVTDITNNQPMPGVNVTITDFAGILYNRTSDASGGYSVADIAPGSFTVMAAAVGYVAKTVTGNISAGQALTLDIPLNRIVADISGPTASITSSTSATITWATDQITTGTIEYGVTTAYGATSSDLTAATQHAIDLAGLTPGATYHFRILSTNSFGFISTSADQTFTMPLISIKFVNDSGNVAIMEIDTSYDAKNADGSINSAARQAVAKEYFKNHPDKDFLVFFSTFDYAMPEPDAKGFYLEVKNDTQGINRTILDTSAQFGSAGMLQGTVDMGNITLLAADLTSTRLDETVFTLNHEVGHRWLTAVRFKLADGTLSSALIGKDDIHWSYLLDSKGSLMYGNGWRDNANGTFTAVSPQSGFSPLDLYLMGMLPKEQVPAMLLIDNPAIDKTKLPELGVTITGTAKTVTIDDIIAAEGERIPNASSSQKKFNIGFVLLTKAGDTTTAAVQAVETVRNAFAGRFAELTRGIGGIEGVAPSLTLTIDSPANGATITSPETTVSGSFINSSGAETGITINGVPATVSGSRFIANNIPLQLGDNTITVTATDTNGLTTTTTRTINAQAGNYIQITSNIESGVGPLDVSLWLNGSFTIINPAISATGPVTPQIAAGSTAGEYTAKFLVEGTYTIIASAVGPDGQTYTDTFTITVQNQEKIDNLLRSKWNSVNSYLSGGNITNALSFFTASSKEKYSAIFNQLASIIPNIQATFTEFKTIEIGDGIARYKLIVNEDGKLYAYDIEFLRDETNGLWLLNSY